MAASRSCRQSPEAKPRGTEGALRFRARGQVAQVVERSPEKAGVGGSTPSLATIFAITYRHRPACVWLQLAPIPSSPFRSDVHPGQPHVAGCWLNEPAEDIVVAKRFPALH